MFRHLKEVRKLTKNQREAVEEFKSAEDSLFFFIFKDENGNLAYRYHDSGTITEDEVRATVDTYYKNVRDSINPLVN